MLRLLMRNDVVQFYWMFDDSMFDLSIVTIKSIQVSALWAYSVLSILLTAYVDPFCEIDFDRFEGPVH